MVETGPLASPDAFMAGLKAVIAEHDILRVKGFAAVEGKGARLLIQAVGQRIDGYYDRPFAAGEARATRLVVIGLHDAIEESEAAIRESVARLAAGHVQAAAE